MKKIILLSIIVLLFSANVVNAIDEQFYFDILNKQETKQDFCTFYAYGFDPTIKGVAYGFYTMEMNDGKIVDLNMTATILNHLRKEYVKGFQWMRDGYSSENGNMSWTLSSGNNNFISFNISKDGSTFFITKVELPVAINSQLQAVAKKYQSISTSYNTNFVSFLIKSYPLNLLKGDNTSGKLEFLAGQFPLILYALVSDGKFNYIDALISLYTQYLECMNEDDTQKLKDNFVKKVREEESKRKY